MCRSVISKEADYRHLATELHHWMHPAWASGQFIHRRLRGRTQPRYAVLSLGVHSLWPAYCPSLLRVIFPCDWPSRGVHRLMLQDTHCRAGEGLPLSFQSLADLTEKPPHRHEHGPPMAHRELEARKESGAVSPRRGLFTSAAAAAAARAWLMALPLGGRPLLFLGASTASCTCSVAPTILQCPLMP